MTVKKGNNNWVSPKLEPLSRDELFTILPVSFSAITTTLLAVLYSLLQHRLFLHTNPSSALQFYFGRQRICAYPLPSIQLGHVIA